MESTHWYKVKEENKLLTPGLLVYPERIKENIASMIKIAGGNGRLWPHIKTHKMREVVKLQMEQGITRFKCATLGEVELLISCNVTHILLAHQPTEEKAKYFLSLQASNPQIQFSTLVDNLDSLQLFSTLAAALNQELSLWIDINNGMNRTGIVPELAYSLFEALIKDKLLEFQGLHVYDGHIRPLKLENRIEKCNSDFAAVNQLIETIESKGGNVPNIIAGGSPSFFPHSLNAKVILSPGTTLLWDLGYKRIWEESPFLNAAVVVTRLISIPNKNIFCFDLGHKAIASEMPLPRVEIFGLEGAVHKGQSEEHLIIEYTEENTFKVGDLFYAIPYHICPTVAKYNRAYTVHQGNLGASWKIDARDYHLEI
jgi:D-serine deaminase-like pyridoxal phosphate-dependent protein